jgi:hypothetical protein
VVLLLAADEELQVVSPPPIRLFVDAISHVAGVSGVPGVGDLGLADRILMIDRPGLPLEDQDASGTLMSSCRRNERVVVVDEQSCADVDGGPVKGVRRSPAVRHQLKRVTDERDSAWQTALVLCVGTLDDDSVARFREGEPYSVDVTAAITVTADTIWKVDSLAAAQQLLELLLDGATRRRRQELEGVRQEGRFGRLTGAALAFEVLLLLGELQRSQVRG